MAKGTFYITTPLYYVNDLPHLGHAFEVIGIDVQARFRRLQGYDVRLQTGTDEHGQKVADTAARRGKTPQEHVDEIAPEFARVWKLLGISCDDFIRTTEPRHHRAAQELWRRAVANGDIYFADYEAWYDVKEESFITETEMEALGLQPDGKRIVRMKEGAYFFRLSRYRERIRAHIEANPEFVQPDFRRNEVIGSFLRDDLPDLCVSRSTLKWGIPIPDAPGHVMYVWFDALTNYISAVGFGDPAQQDSFHKWWPADVHVIGKDILKFHAVYWPAFLLSAGLPLPRQVFAHGWIMVGRGDAQAPAEKMSKSAGNTINPLAFCARIGAEPLRYFMMRSVNYGGDGMLNESELELRYKAELSDGLGNLLSRTLAMAERYLGGAVTRTTPEQRTDEEAALVQAWQDVVADYERAMPRFEYHTALGRVWDFIGAMNAAINRVEPWALHKKGETARLAVFLSALAEGLAHVSVLLTPFMPETADRMRATLGVALPDWETATRWGGMFDRLTVAKPTPLFPPLEEKIQAQ